MKIRLFRPLLVLIGVGLLTAPVFAETRVEKALKLEPGGRFNLETELGKVTVKGTSSSGVRLIVTANRDDINDLLTFRYEEGNGSASVVAKKRHHFDSWFGNWSSRVLFEV